MKIRLFLHGEEENSWQLLFSILMTVLMIFFLILFVFFYTGGSPELLSDKIILDDLSIEKLEQVKKIFKKTQELEMGKKLKLVLENPLLFKSGRAQLNKQAFIFLDKLSEVLKEMKGSKVVVEGHTDNIPIRRGARFSSNRELSQYRALNMVHYLIKKGVDPETIAAVGWGEHNPMVSNDTPEHRAKNRRIEILLSGKDFF